MSRYVNITVTALAAVAIVVMFVSSGEAVVSVLRGTPRFRPSGNLKNSESDA